MITDRSQRWTERRESYRRAGREIFDASAHDVELIDQATAKAFVKQHHYAGECSPTAHPFGLFERGTLLGVAVFGPLPSVNAHNAVFGPAYAQTQCVTLGRFVLVEAAGINAESWFIARCFDRLPSRGVIAVETCADPVERHTPDGVLVKPGHIGTIYQATSMQYVGKTNPASLPLLPNGTVLSNRAESKTRSGERGAGRAVEQLVAFGAQAPRDGEDLKAWLQFWRPRICTTFRHYGNHRYIRVLDRRHRKAILGNKPNLSYPKIGA